MTEMPITFAEEKAQRRLELELLEEKLSQEDVNQKLLRSLSPEWNTHVVVWRNKADLDTMSMEDLYNNLKAEEWSNYAFMAFSSSSSDSKLRSSSSDRHFTRKGNTKVQRSYEAVVGIESSWRRARRPQLETGQLSLFHEDVIFKIGFLVVNQCFQPSKQLLLRSNTNEIRAQFKSAGSISYARLLRHSLGRAKWHDLCTEDKELHCANNYAKETIGIKRYASRPGNKAATQGSQASARSTLKAATQGSKASAGSTFKIKKMTASRLTLDKSKK
nr:ribonuclease H-like domain-containing protein [Tanacetum cinerariifolium]